MRILAIEVFNRYEKKYKISESTLCKLTEKLSDYMEPDKFNKDGKLYKISNIYYDTCQSDIIRTSLAKPKYKEKLRLRGYGVPGEEDIVFAEIKKKVGGLVNKRRSSLKLCQAYNFLETGKIPVIKDYMNAQVLNEISYLLSQKELSPAVYLSYDRMAFFGIGMHDLRISFDTNITARRDDLRLERGSYGEKLLPNGIWLMEVKSSESIPLWLSKLLSEFEVFPASFSKYGTEFTNRLKKDLLPSGVSA